MLRRHWRSRRSVRRSSPWGRLALGVLGGYATSTVVLASVAAFGGVARAEWTSWSLLLAPVFSVFLMAYAFAARNLRVAARDMAVLCLLSVIARVLLAPPA